MKKIEDIHFVCDVCGIKANYLTQKKKFGKDFDEEKFKPSAAIATYHFGICDFCGEKRYVTSVRKFFYPDFKLLKNIIHNQKRGEDG